MFVTFFTGDCSQNELLEWSHPLITSWKKASEDDHNFYALRKVRQHDDGWGVYQYFKAPNGKEQYSLTKNFTPAFESNHPFTIDFDTVTNFISLYHARKASLSMPISLNQNHPYVNENGTLILAHNGTMNKDVILSLLTTKPRSTDNLSDTQLFFSLLKERFDTTASTNSQALYQTWKTLIDQIKVLHVQASKRYSINLFFLIKDPATKLFSLLYTSLYSDPLSEDYLKIYAGKDNQIDVLCSSTVADYLENDFPAIFKKLGLHSIPNGSIGLISQNSVVDKIQEVL